MGDRALLNWHASMNIFFQILINILAMLLNVTINQNQILFLSLEEFLLSSFRPKIVLKGLFHPLDCVTNPTDKWLHFLTTKFFLQRERGTGF